MQVTTITVKAGRTFNHPIESYSNLRTDAAMTATLSDGEDPVEATRALRDTVETLCEEHKQRILADIVELEERQRRAQRRMSLDSEIERLQRQRSEFDEEQPKIGEQPDGSVIFPSGDGTLR